jgi:hypothetical protein
MFDITTVPREALKTLLNYMGDEADHYAAAHGIDPVDATQHARANPDPKHIFTSMVKLADWLNATEPRPVAAPAAA